MTMKAVKIILSVAVVATIGYFVFKEIFEAPPAVFGSRPPINPFVERIEKKIENLSHLPVNVFCRDSNAHILYLIADYHKNEFLGANSSQNEQWRDILTKELYVVYSAKFIEQAFDVFGKPDWRPGDLNIIRTETRALKASPQLDRGSPVDSKFDEILSILNRYDAITGLISSFPNFPLNPTYQMDEKFPVQDVLSKLQSSREYIATGMGNIYVNNCRRLHEGLGQAPNILFSNHTEYLQNKVINWTGKYTEHSSFENYSNAIFKPLEQEIRDLLYNYREIYGLSGKEQEINNIANILNSDNNRAWAHFTSINR